MTPVSGQIIGTGAVVRLSTAFPTQPLVPKGKWINYQAKSDNSNPALIGGAEVTSTVGFPIYPGATNFDPPVSELTDFYDLTTIFVFVAAGDVLYVRFGG